ncbi:hypothetical protein V8D89_013852 [Ganoderma adspersum]
MPDENGSPQVGQKRPSEDSLLTLPPRKKAYLILVGLQLDKDLSLSPANGIEKYPAEKRLQYQIYTQVIRAIPELEEGLMNQTIRTDELKIIATRIQAGISGARSDDVKGVKHAIIGWITDPEKGLVPSIDHRYMTGCGWNHEVTGRKLCPGGLDWDDPAIKSALKAGTLVVRSDQWPICFYLNRDYDLERPWVGLLHGRLLLNAYKHIFTSPSSVDDSGRATKGNNCFINGMAEFTVASIVYIATLLSGCGVRFALGSRPTFTRSDTITDSQTFYNVLLAFLTHPHERENLNELLLWWNEQVFPHAIAVRRAPTAKSPLARCVEEREKRVALLAVSANTSG